jgi:hypothetical protein
MKETLHSNQFSNGVEILSSALTSILDMLSYSVKRAVILFLLANLVTCSYSTMDCTLGLVMGCVRTNDKKNGWAKGDTGI